MFFRAWTLSVNFAFLLQITALNTEETVRELSRSLPSRAPRISMATLTNTCATRCSTPTTFLTMPLETRNPHTKSMTSAIPSVDQPPFLGTTTPAKKRPSSSGPRNGTANATPSASTSKCLPAQSVRDTSTTSVPLQGRYSFAQMMAAYQLTHPLFLNVPGPLAVLSAAPTPNSTPSRTTRFLLIPTPRHYLAPSSPPPQ